MYIGLGLSQETEINEYMYAGLGLSLYHLEIFVWKTHAPKEILNEICKICSNILSECWNIWREFLWAVSKPPHSAFKGWTRNFEVRGHAWTVLTVIYWNPWNFSFMIMIGNKRQVLWAIYCIQFQKIILDPYALGPYAWVDIGCDQRYRCWL